MLLPFKNIFQNIKAVCCQYTNIPQEKYPYPFLNPNEFLTGYRAHFANILPLIWNLIKILLNFQRYKLSFNLKGMLRPLDKYNHFLVPNMIILSNFTKSIPLLLHLVIKFKHPEEARLISPRPRKNFNCHLKLPISSQHKITIYFWYFFLWA